ncbi:MAG: FAD-dependent monooxygenase [Anaerolineae bacterium]|nr:FAD-dependent monooxygenase [Anaerolineae bacterium]
MIDKHAIVIGSSIAGLMTARVLSERFARVTILERDRLPNGPEERAGTPQGKHVHNLLVRGLRIMEDLFPGFDDELAAAGAPMMNYGRDVRLLVSFHQWMPNVETDFASRAASRALVEHVIRHRVLALPNVEVCERVIVDGLLMNENKQRVTGVRVAPRGTSEPYDMQGDFVVDASGRRSRTPQWLEQLGLPTPETTVVDSEVGYATRLYRKPKGFDKWTVLYMPARLPSVRGGAIFEVENDIWMASLGGYNRQYPPTNEAEFLEYARTLPQPDLYDAIKDGEPLSGIISYRNTRNIRYHYERINLPTHFVLLGDAVCGFNPIYGQGMTSAAMGAVQLGETLDALHGDLDAVTAQFQKQLAALHDSMWLLATGEDLAFIHLESGSGDGPDPGWFDRFVQKYAGYCVVTTPSDPHIVQTLFEITNLTKPPTALFHPRIAVSVLWHQFIRPRLGMSPKVAASN